MNEVQKTFDEIKEYCKPRYSTQEEATHAIFKSLFLGKHSNFIGGCNDKRRTMHETMFALMRPDLQQQVSFGTGKSGYEKYGFKRVVVDFYDENRNIVYEIDGRNHTNKLQNIKDQIKECFLKIEYGVKTIRFSNESVEKMIIDRLEILEAEGRLSC